jgi:hypothetical protein
LRATLLELKQVEQLHKRLSGHKLILCYTSIICRSFWSGAAANAVVVEADAFKETDVIYRAISSRGHHNDMLQTAELVFASTMFVIFSYYVEKHPRRV